MNEIVIDEHDNATVSGSLAHALRYQLWDKFTQEVPEMEPGKFYVAEITHDQMVIIKAVQSSFKLAASYSNIDRVIVYLN